MFSAVMRVGHRPTGGGGDLPTGSFQRPDKIYQSRSTIVGVIDLTLSCVNLLIAVVMLVKVKTRGSSIRALRVMFNRPDAVWRVLVLMELVSIPFAALLLKGTSQSAKQQNPKGAAYYCNIWLISCVTWILFYMAAIAIMVKYCEVYGTKAPQEFVYFHILILSIIIVLRLGAINIVILYTNELRKYSHERLQNLPA